MSAEERLRNGDLDGALTAVQELVRSKPAESRQRVFLFQLHVVRGEWDRALTQLAVLKDLDAGALPMVQAYREAIRCERLRQSVFAGERSPLVFGEPEPWIASVVQALALTARGEHAAAEELRAQAFDDAPATPGRIDGAPFAWIADADSRLGPLLEALLNGRYYWIPLHRIRQISFEDPEDLRDVVWMPAHFVWTNGGDTLGLIPTRYVGSETSADAGIRLARKTEWQQVSPSTFVGTGQRMLATDAGEFALLDARRIELETVVDPASAAGREEPPDA